MSESESVFPQADRLNEIDSAAKTIEAGGGAFGYPFDQACACFLASIAHNLLAIAKSLQERGPR